MAVAGSLTYDTKLDTKGFKEGLNKVGGIAKGVAIGVGASITAIGVGLTAMIKQSIDSYAEYEQLVDGVKSMFGGIEKGAEQINSVVSKANGAWKDLTMSQNEYYNTFNSTYPLMKNDIEDQNEAIEQTNRLMTLESDLANTFGYSMETATTAVNWALKGTFSYIDNLNIGIKGTQEGFLEAAHSVGYMVDDVKDLSSSDILDILEKVADQYGVLGKTAEEARTTIQGSTKMMRSAWSNLLNGIADDNADFDKLVGDFVEAVGYSFDNLLPRILIALQGVGKLIPKLGEILLEHLPEIMEAGQNIINGLMEAIVNALPILITTGTQILQSLLDGIIQYLPQIMPIIVQVILSIVNFITDNLPTLLQAGITILITLAQGITEALPELIPAVIDAIVLVSKTLIDNLDQIIIAAIDLVLALAEGILEALPDLIAIIPDLIIAIVTKLLSPEMLLKLQSVGPKLMLALAKALIENIPNLLSAIPKIIVGLFNGLKNTITQTDWLSLGKNILKGILNGMLDFGTIVKDTIKKVGNKITNSFKSFFSIKSPSRLMRDEVGKYLPQGIAVGIEADTDKALDSIDKMNNEIYDRMKQAVDMETGTMSFSGTAGSVSQILSSNATFDGNFVVKAEVEEGTLFEAQQRITKRKNLQTGFGG